MLIKIDSPGFLKDGKKGQYGEASKRYKRRRRRSSRMKKTARGEMGGAYLDQISVFWVVVRTGPQGDQDL